MVKVRKSKSLSTQVPKVSRPTPKTNIIKTANLYLVASDVLLSKKVSAAKELNWELTCWVGFFLNEENILLLFNTYKLIEFSDDREEYMMFINPRKTDEGIKVSHLRETKYNCKPFHVKRKCVEP